MNRGWRKEEGKQKRQEEEERKEESDESPHREKAFHNFSLFCLCQSISAYSCELPNFSFTFGLCLSRLSKSSIYTNLFISVKIHLRK